MRILCTNGYKKNNSLNVGMIYHMMKEDDRFYYVVDSTGEIRKHAKNKFTIVNVKVKMKMDLGLKMPNDNLFILEKDDIYDLHGNYTHYSQVKDEYITMYVIKIKDFTPIAIPKNCCEIIEC